MLADGLSCSAVAPGDLDDDVLAFAVLRLFLFFSVPFHAACLRSVDLGFVLEAWLELVALSEHHRCPDLIVNSRAVVLCVVESLHAGPNVLLRNVLHLALEHRRVVLSGVEALRLWRLVVDGFWRWKLLLLDQAFVGVLLDDLDRRRCPPPQSATGVRHCS